MGADQNSKDCFTATVVPERVLEREKVVFFSFIIFIGEKAEVVVIEGLHSIG